MPPNRNVNIYISSQITAFSRQVIHECLLQVAQTPKSKIIAVDCDSIMFTLPNTMQCPLPISNAVGDFKNEICGNVLSFFSFGPKNYVITYQYDDIIHVIRKISGLCLAQTSDLNSELYERFLDDYARDVFSSKTFSQKKSKIDFSDLSVKVNNYSFSLTNNVSKKRIVDKASLELNTYPYGFCR